MYRLTPYFTAGLLLCSAPVVLAAPTPKELSTQAQALFEQRRDLESRSHHGRIRILQEAEACIQAAQNFRDYRDCERTENAARQALQDELRPAGQALRDEAQALRRQFEPDAAPAP